MADGDPPPHPPTLIAERYRLGDPLTSARGAETFAAVDLALAREVSVRLLSEAPPADEVRRAASLDHPAIVRLVAEGTDPRLGRPYLVFERPAGGTLADRLISGDPPPWPHERALRAAGDIAEGLAVAHEAGFLYGSIDADRIAFDADGRAKLELPGLGTSAISGAVMAPEVELSRQPSRSGDLYALGALLHLLLTGEPYAPGARIASPAGLGSGAAGLLVALLAQDAERRPPSARAVAGRLRALAVQARGARRTFTSVVESPARASLGSLAIAFAILVAAGAGIAYAVTQDDEAPPPATVTSTVPTAPTTSTIGTVTDVTTDTATDVVTDATTETATETVTSTDASVPTAPAATDATTAP